jgi:anti-anti-sigma factor
MEGKTNEPDKYEGSSQPLAFTFQETVLSGSVRQFALIGVLDSGSAIIREDELFNQVTESDGTVLMDLSQLTFLSSAGIRVIIRCGKDLKKAGGELHLAAPQPRVMAVLTIAGLVPVFPLYQTLQEAYTALSVG